MILSHQTLRRVSRDALLLARLAQDKQSEAVLLLPLGKQAANVTDGTSNTIMFGELATRPAGRTEMMAMWSQPRLLAEGFGLQMPQVGLSLFHAGMWLPGLQLQPSGAQDGRAATTAAGTRALRVAATVASTGGSAIGFGLAALWFAPRSIVGVLIGL